MSSIGPARPPIPTMRTSASALGLKKTIPKEQFIKMCKNILTNLDHLDNPQLTLNRPNINRLRVKLMESLRLSFTNLKNLFELYSTDLNESSNTYRALSNIELNSFNNVNSFKAETPDLKKKEDRERLRRIVTALLNKLDSGATLNRLLRANEIFRTSTTSGGRTRRSKRNRKQRRRYTRRQK